MWAVLASVIAVLGFYPYIRNVLKGETQPHEFTWLIFLLTQGTATAILWASGGGRGAVALTIGSVLIAAVFILSLLDGKRDITKSDVACLVLALAAFPIWLVLEKPLSATLLLTSIDLLGYVPTFRKSYAHPWREAVTPWAIFFFSDVCSILALEQYTVLTLVYLVAVTSANVAIIVFLLVRRKQLTLSRTHHGK